MNFRGRNGALGKQGEKIGVLFLSRKGYKIIGTNIKTFVGEIDIIAKKESSLVFIEVKTRKSTRYGPPYLSVTERKKRKLINSALCYLKMKKLLDTPWRIDVISIEIKRLFWFVNRVKIEHFADAIQE